MSSNYHHGGLYDDYKSYDNYYRRCNNHYSSDSWKKAKEPTYTPSTSSSSSSSSCTLSPSKTSQLDMKDPAFIFACLLVTLAALINIVWLAIPTANYIYSQFPTANALEWFAQCTLVGLVYVLGATIIIRIIVAVCDS